MLIAIEGCGHGELDKIYAAIAEAEQRNGVKVDLLLICGDFQAVRNHGDLATMACPAKYRQIGNFYQYYSGEKACCFPPPARRRLPLRASRVAAAPQVAPVLTLFIGGNHEASSHNWELYHGGWAAPNIFFLGYANVVNVGGVRIGGLSGIFNHRHYRCGHYEAPPYTEDTMRSAYHVRELEVFKLLQLRRPVDVFLSHDWPQHIARHGDTQSLFRRKSFLRAEVEDGSLGSPPAKELLQHLKPSYWFSAHLHVQYASVVKHQDGSATRFLSLDKCLPNRDFLQLVEIAGDGSPVQLRYDAEWLAVLRATSGVFSVARGALRLDAATLAKACGGRTDFRPTDEEIAELEGHDLVVPANFQITAPPHRPGETPGCQASFHENPQTSAFVARFGLRSDFRSQTLGGHSSSDANPMFQPMEANTEELVEEIDIGDD
ncbi:hypothetical protein AB1Y20_011239 [Prymnesium parvum]|uniref:Lariat debranching enzyme C-terminal domain-containing protein n=1 Tax=Prymnesium parvum TaxID=97485 RepID=A0AB34ILA5_PRYPA